MSTRPAPSRRSILITGTSRGIGLHLARRFLSLDYQVTGVSRTPTAIDAPHFRWLQADLTDPAEVERLGEVVRSEQFTGFIHNAGIHGPIGPFEALSVSDWRRTFDVNLFSGAALSQACIPGLRRRRGFIIFLSGGGSAFPRPRFSAYGVSKTAVVRLAEVLAHELLPDVLVYCVAPGPNRTALLDEAVQEGTEVPEAEIVPFSMVEDLCVFLAENRDPRYSGKFIHVRDDYRGWVLSELAPDAYTLRRIKP